MAGETDRTDTPRVHRRRRSDNPSHFGTGTDTTLGAGCRPVSPPPLADVGALTGDALRDVGHRAGLILDPDAQPKELDAVRHGVVEHLLQPGQVDVAAAEEGHDPFDVPVAEGHEGSVVHR